MHLLTQMIFNEIQIFNFHISHLYRVATVREKCLENDFFPGQGKVREFCGWPGKFRKDLESQGI